MTSSRRTGRLPVIGALIIGIGLMIAPVIFQMFTRAPLGGDMIDDFAPYMTPAKVEAFRGYMTTIDTANADSLALRDDLVAAGVVTPDVDPLASVSYLNETWAAVDADMTDLIDRMERNIGSYDAVASLPSFDLFPWFFVLPGLMIAGLSASILWSLHRDGRPVRRLWSLFAVGLMVVAAPAVFQMFTRAPEGRSMIDDFRPMMTRERVQNVQGYFVTMGAAEGQLRVQAPALVEQAGGDLADYPALAAWSAQWPQIVMDFNPMVAAMSNNVDNFEAVDAMPNFDLFPWFFVIPGALTAAGAFVALRRVKRATSPVTVAGSDPAPAPAS